MQKAVPTRLEAWKKVADESVGSIFFSVPIDGPKISGELKEYAMDALYRITFFDAYGDLPEKERWLAYKADRAGMEEYASRLIDKAVARWWASGR